MSILNIESNQSPISPRIWLENKRLYIRTAIIYRILNLFFYSRTVIVDKAKKHIEICIKTFWFWKSRQYIQFKDIEYIDVFRREVEVSHGPALIQNRYYIKVFIKNHSAPSTLFRFIGDESLKFFSNAYGVYDIQGEKASNYAELVSKFTGIKLWKNKKVEFKAHPKGQYLCSKCNRTNHPTASSAYIAIIKISGNRSLFFTNKTTHQHF